MLNPLSKYPDIRKDRKEVFAPDDDDDDDDDDDGGRGSDDNGDGDNM